jgi:beta-1,4-mannosyl-glycoprotein beta-1,4-N-acetylglucosaminyltransferase
VFQQQMRRYYLNGTPQGAKPWPGTRMTRYRDLGSPNNLRCWGGAIIAHGGWHFSYLGGVERIQTKLASISQQKFNTPEFTDTKRLAEDLEAGRNFVIPDQPIRYDPLDAGYPVYLLQNQARFRHLIRQ